MGNDTVCLDIVPNERIVFAYAMLIAERRHLVALATVELSPSGGGTHLLFTEQGAFFEPSDGPQLREAGWRGLLDKVETAPSESSDSEGR
jgi:uncharacterized protein YndB with AHSA1/START domain